jgi:pimeloyl-ACP methyl ester carboxylesterase
VLVHGGLGDHRRWDPLRPHLEPHFTVHAMDRRGRGASGDQPEYDVAREFEDVAAVVDSVAEASQSKVNLYGISHGGICALGAATQTSNIRRLVIYEGWPPLPVELTAPADVEERLDAMLAEGKREALLEFAYRHLLNLTDEQLDELRAAPAWKNRVAAAHTIPREVRAAREAMFTPEQASKIKVPTLLLVGSESPDWQPERFAAMLPDARIAVLEGQEHTADLFAPELVARELVAFLRD